MESFDLIVIGSGPGGYVAAIRASQNGLKCAIVEKKHIGGVCLNIGCIPTKALIKSAETINLLKKGEELGFEFDNFRLNYTNAFNRSRKISLQLSSGIEKTLKKENIQIINGTANFISSNTINIKETNETFKAKDFIIATGSSPKTLKGFEFDNEKIISSNDFLLSKNIPKSMIILGAGAIGVETAYILNSFGCNVTIIEYMPNLLPIEDTDSSKVLEREFKKSKIKVITNAMAKSIAKTSKGISLNIEKKGKEQTIDAEKCLIAVGRNPNSSNLGIEKLGIEIDSKGFIKVDNNFLAKDHIYAIGDVINTPLLAHVASHEGIYTVDYISEKKPHSINYNIVPSCTYSSPQVASFGPTEKQLQDKNIEYNEGTFTLKASGKALTLGENNGNIKILSDKLSKKILSASIVGVEASELIHEIIIAASSGLKVDELANIMHAHPTLSESIMEAAMNVNGKAIHSLI